MLLTWPMGQGADYADVRLVERSSRTWRQNERWTGSTPSKELGLGVRVLAGGLGFCGRQRPGREATAATWSAPWRSPAPAPGCGSSP